MKRYVLAGICWLSLWVALPALAQFVPISAPNLAYTSGTTQIAIAAADGTSVSSVSDGVQTLTLSTNLDVHTVPGGGWNTWGSPPDTEGATPRVLGIYTALTTETITLSAPKTTFGIELEPDAFGAFDISVDFMNGATLLGTVTRSASGSAGAKLFAATSATQITSVVIRAPTGASGFALARPRYGNLVANAVTSVPTLSEWGVMLLAGLLATGALLRLRKDLKVGSQLR